MTSPPSPSQLQVWKAISHSATSDKSLYQPSRHQIQLYKCVPPPTEKITTTPTSTGQHCQGPRLGSLTCWSGCDLVRVRVGQGASWSGCELVRVRGCELTNRVRVDSGASWYWGELTRKRLQDTSLNMTSVGCLGHFSIFSQPFLNWDFCVEAKILRHIVFKWSLYDHFQRSYGNFSCPKWACFGRHPGLFKTMEAMAPKTLIFL